MDTVGASTGDNKFKASFKPDKDFEAMMGIRESDNMWPQTTCWVKYDKRNGKILKAIE